MAVPAGFSKMPARIPLSIQIIGKPFEEETVYAAGYA
jgi:Asp-tRNA(Asn)/Glu-tRNA(Gln) amidotransferase A subunit family amidase